LELKTGEPVIGDVEGVIDIASRVDDKLPGDIAAVFGDDIAPFSFRNKKMHVCEDIVLAERAAPRRVGRDMAYLKVKWVDDTPEAALRPRKRSSLSKRHHRRPGRD
jgi:hypothetical protein